jgi:hypothetical protein
MFALESLEDRRLLAWGAYPQLIQQDDAVATYPTITGAGVNIALIDSGVDFNQPNLAGKFWTNPGEIAGNGKDDDGDGYVDDTRGWDFYGNDNTPEDQNGHGTATAGIIAASSFTFGGATYQGIAPGAKIIPLKVSDPTGGYNLAFAQHVEKALQWVEKNYQKYNIRIVSMSIRTPLADYNATYADEVSRLLSDGLFLVAAGGQEDPNIDVEYPARTAGVFGVSVVEANDTFPTDNVNRGPGIDLLAPGDGVPILLRGSGATASAQATSYSTPFAAATAALLLQVNPKLTATQLTNILKNSGSSVKDTSTGFTYSGLTYKRLNVFNAIKQAQATVGTTTGSISGVIFVDANGNGVKDATEVTPLAATIYLDANNNGIRDNGELMTSSSSRTGKYAFSSVPVGTYSVRQIPPSGYRQTLPRRYYAETIAAGTTLVNINFGDTTLAYVSARVWNDANANKAIDSGEAGLAGWMVFIDSNNDGLLGKREARVTTDANGYFVFSTLAPGTYVFRLVQQKGWTPTGRIVATITLGAGQVYSKWGFGERR